MQRVGGINTYFAGLIGSLPAETIPYITCTGAPDNLPINSHQHLFRCNRFAFRPGRLAYWLEKYYFRAVESWVAPDLVHPTFYRTLTRRYDRISPTPYVLTVWDFLHDHYPSQLDREGTWRPHVGRMINGAEALLCISNHTKQELLERYPHVASRAFVTRLATTLTRSISTSSELTLPPYLLYVGGRAGYKNFSTALMAFTIIARETPDLEFVVVGSPWSEEENRSIASSNARHRIRLETGVTNDRLASLYTGAVALLYTSEHEGFGLPALEAAACSCPVIASSGTSIPEILGNYPLLCDTKSVDAVVERIGAVLKSSSLREQAVLEGENRSRLFSWRATADSTNAIYRKVLGISKGGVS